MRSDSGWRNDPERRTNVDREQKGAEVPPVYGHLGGMEPIVKPACKGRFLFFQGE